VDTRISAPGRATRTAPVGRGLTNPDADFRADWCERRDRQAISCGRRNPAAQQGGGAGGGARVFFFLLAVAGTRCGPELDFSAYSVPSKKSGISFDLVAWIVYDAKSRWVFCRRVIVIEIPTRERGVRSRHEIGGLEGAACFCHWVPPLADDAVAAKPG